MGTAEYWHESPRTTAQTDAVQQHIFPGSESGLCDAAVEADEPDEPQRQECAVAKAAAVARGAILADAVLEKAAGGIVDEPTGDVN